MMTALPRRPLFFVALLAALLSLPAAAAPASQTPSAQASLSAEALTTALQLPGTPPPATPATTYTIGVCASTCVHPTCPTGRFGQCVPQQCYIGYPFPMCAPGDQCVLRCDDL